MLLGVVIGYMLVTGFRRQLRSDVFSTVMPQNISRSRIPFGQSDVWKIDPMPGLKAKIEQLEKERRMIWKWAEDDTHPHIKLRMIRELLKAEPKKEEEVDTQQNGGS
jgi:hypothetical protein